MHTGLRYAYQLVRMSVREREEEGERELRERGKEREIRGRR